jgi:hypothetical protein
MLHEQAAGLPAGSHKPGALSFDGWVCTLPLADSPVRAGCRLQPGVKRFDSRQVEWPRLPPRGEGSLFFLAG